MSLAIQTNTAANSAHRNMTVSSKAQAGAIEKLSSGLRINKAADDAAGLVIAEKLRAQGNGIKMAIRNAHDGIGLIQTADGALTEVTAMLHRMRDLAMHSQNAVTDSWAKTANQAAFTQLVGEIDRISSTTKFGGSPLLDGSFTGVFNVGPTGAGDDLVAVTISLTPGGADALNSGQLGVDVVDLENNPGGAVPVVDAAIDLITAARSLLGATQNRLEHTIKNLGVTGENVGAAESQIRDADMAATMTEFTKQQVLSQASQAMLGQANSSSQGILQLLRG